MRYLITGGSGFIGTYFCETFAALGDEVVILDLFEPAPGVVHAKFVKGDVRDPAAVRLAMQGCDRVLHLAAAHQDFGIERKTFFDVNETGTRIVCDAMDEFGITSTCFYSTVAVYGAAPEPKNEDTPPQPETPYGESKLAGEAVLRTWTEQGAGRRCLVIRPTVTFGPRNFANMYMLMDAIQRGRFLIVGRGENIKSLSYVEHIVDATMYLWEREGRPAFDLVNYIDKPDLTSMQITAAVYKALGKKMPMGFPFWLVRLLAVPFDVVIALTGKNLPISSARLKKMYVARTKYEADRLRESGFEYTAPLEETIGRMVKWYLETGQNERGSLRPPPAEPVMMQGPGLD